jgi:hypothetical protein
VTSAVAAVAGSCESNHPAAFLAPELPGHHAKPVTSPLIQMLLPGPAKGWTLVACHYSNNQRLHHAAAPRDSSLLRFQANIPNVIALVRIHSSSDTALGVNEHLNAVIAGCKQTPSVLHHTLQSLHSHLRRFTNTARADSNAACRAAGAHYFMLATMPWQTALRGTQGHSEGLKGTQGQILSVPFTPRSHLSGQAAWHHSR